MRTTRLRVTLREVASPVLRVIDVPATCTLPELHDLLQASLGWTQSHLHLFIADEERYTVPDEDNLLEARDQTGVCLRDEDVPRFVEFRDIL